LAYALNLLGSSSQMPPKTKASGSNSHRQNNQALDSNLPIAKEESKQGLRRFLSPKDGDFTGVASPSDPLNSHVKSQALP